TRLHQLQYAATRLRERSLTLSLAVLVGANLLVFGWLASAVLSGSFDLGPAVVVAPSALGVAMIAFGGLNRAVDGGAVPAAAGAGAGNGGRRRVAARLSRRRGDAKKGDPLPRRELRLPGRAGGARRLRRDDPGRQLAGDRRPERCRQDDARQAAMPPVRPDVR